MKKCGIFINCSRCAFIAWILSGVKLYETRSRNVLRNLVGRRVFLIETGRGRPMVTGSAIISGVSVVRFDDVKMRSRAKITGTEYDIPLDGAKYFYRLRDVRKLKKPFPLPDQRENHGRSWTAW